MVTLAKRPFQQSEEFSLSQLIRACKEIRRYLIGSMMNRDVVLLISYDTVSRNDFTMTMFPSRHAFEMRHRGGRIVRHGTIVLLCGILEW